MSEPTQPGPGARVVVVGAGFGGLAAAIRLARAGLSVTVIEAQAGPGGKARTLPSAAGPVDAGPTVLTLRAVFDDLFTLCGTRLEDHATLIPQPLLARHWWPDGSSLDLFSDAEASATAIAAFAGPREAAAFRRFHALTARLYDAFEGPVMLSPRPDSAAILRAALRDPGLWPALLPGMTLARLLRLYFRDPRLRQLFGRYATYVGGTPSRSPAVLALIWQAEARGVWAVQGGMHGLAQALAKLAAAQGVQFRYGTGVARIIWQGGRVSGVQLDDKRSLACDRVVFNGDPAALRAGLLGGGAKAALPASAVTKRSLSAYVWAFAARAEGLPLAYHNVFFAADPAREFGPIRRGTMPEDPTLYLCAEDRATGTVPQGAERFEIIMNGPPLRDGQPAPEEDSKCHSRTFPPLARFGLTFTPTPDTRSLTTPQGFARAFPGSQGALYGLSPEGMMAAFHRPGAKTLLPGLYLAGGGAHPGAGVPMAALSGKHAAGAMLADLALPSKSAPTAMPGGMSMVSRMTGGGRSRSSGS
ncbi:phytoene desaturase [Fertoebacter nigrum]|uniref:Phytoene desaturase n=2 Tax=Fertoeibacter niger TaxID=2656921 RepID=A0A8X8KM36_9RHOB|nr:phytoene desaturase [Fertoeibacter niger]